MGPSVASSGGEDAQQHLRRKSTRKLQKRRPYDPSANMEMPERLKRGDEEGEEDLTVAASQGPTMLGDMNQSIWGLIAAAGSRVDFNERLQAPSSEDEDDADDDETGPTSKTTVFKKKARKPESGHARKRSGHKLLRSLPALPRLAKTRKEAELSKLSSLETPTEGSSDVSDRERRASSEEESTADDNRLAPVMSRMLQGQAEMAARPSFDMERGSGESTHDVSGSESGPSKLARKLKEIFEFDQPEEVIVEYPCWLLQCVLLQGFMYVTTNHICFYSYLPKKANDVPKSGYLAKSGRRNPKYNRYWFRLKGDVLSYFPDTTNVYFPSGQIDLRYGISAAVSDKSKDGTYFTVRTANRTYNFKADSAPSAKEWVKAIQRVIFRSHNDGDSVKISLPMVNVIDIEDTQDMLSFAETCKIRVVDNDETFAIDEYYFSFFNNGKQAIELLKILVEGMAGRGRDVPTLATPSGPSPKSPQSMEKFRVGMGRDVVRATLSPMSPSGRSSPRASAELSRTSFDALKPFKRRSLDIARELEPSSRRSFSNTRRSQSQTRRVEARDKQQASSESYVQSMDDPSMSAQVLSSSEEPSASQILKGSDVFRSPTMRRSISSSRVFGKMRGRSRSTSRREQSPAASTGRQNDHGTMAVRLSRDQPPTPTLQSISKMGAYPLQRAGAFASYLNNTSRKMSTLLASESMGYVEKVSGMWKGGRKHYEQPPGLKTDEDDEEDDELKHADANERFRAHFMLPETERLQSTYFGHLFRVLPLYGKIYISDQHFCFRSLLPGTRTKIILPLKDIENVVKEKGFTFGYSGLVVVVRGHEEMFFEFHKMDHRDDCTVTLLQSLETMRFLKESGILHETDKELEQSARAERDALKEERSDDLARQNDANPTMMPGWKDSHAPTVLFDDPKSSILEFKPSQPLNVTCLTIGSRGDVQPYIALSKGLLAEGHRPTIATHVEFKDWIESHGIRFMPVAGDPGELMRLCIENGTFTWAFLREANSMFRGWLDELLVTSWTACEGADLLIESPSAMAGIHIAEALAIPYFRAFTMPWTRTRAYPHSFLMPQTKMGGHYNVHSYTLFDHIFWKATAAQMNHWRRNTLKLPNTSLEKMQPNKVPFLYNFSPSVVPPPIDYSDWIRVTGYWFLDEGTGNQWTPPNDLANFIAKARADKKKIVYVGFGSIIVDDPAKMTQEVIDAVQAADVRCILSKGWSDRNVKNRPSGESSDEPGTSSAAPAPATEEPEMPPEIHVIKSAPHDWLFAQIDAAAHHGGSGTTGASLRAGIPTIIRPFFGDQFFFGSRVEDLGVGIWLRKWGATSFGRALWQATHNQRMIDRSRLLGQRIRKETGVDTAIQCIYRDMEYARSLIKKTPDGKGVAGKGGAATDDDDDEGEAVEEAWTFVGHDQPDPEVLTRRLSDLFPGPEQ